MIPVSSLSLAQPTNATRRCLFSHPGRPGGRRAPPPALRRTCPRKPRRKASPRAWECVGLRADRAGVPPLSYRRLAAADASPELGDAPRGPLRARGRRISVPRARRARPPRPDAGLLPPEYKKADPSRLARAGLVFAGAARRGIEKACAEAAIIADAVAMVRDLVDRAPSDKTPESIAALAQNLAGAQTKVTVISKAEAEKLGMGAFLGVARGGGADPVFLHLTYKPKGARRKIGLVGKGITFDSGGLSLKPAASMETMKMDMAGAAAVLGVFKALPQFKIRAEVHGFCPFTYNLPGPDAVRPGDVLKAMNGKTIEVLNTDAEGRLVLADALVYACRQKFDAIVDLATTGPPWSPWAAR